MPATTATYTTLPGTLGGPLSQRRSGQSRFYLPDHQGNMRQLTDAPGSTTDLLLTDAWGMQIASSGTTVNPFKALGQWGYFSDRSNYLYVRARYLKPALARWISRDPLPDNASYAGAYDYGANRPLLFVDPTGLQPEEPCCTLKCLQQTNPGGGAICIYTLSKACNKAYQSVRDCGVTEDDICRVYSQGECCKAASQFGVPDNCLCGLALTETYTGFNLFCETFIQGLESTVGCVQLSVGTAKQAIDKIMTCRADLYKLLLPIPKSDKELKKRLIDDCAWAMKVLASFIKVNMDPKCTRTGQPGTCENAQHLYNPNNPGYTKKRKCIMSNLVNPCAK